MLGAGRRERDVAGRVLRQLEGWSDRRALLVFVTTVGVLAIAANAWIYGAQLTYFNQPPIRSDGVGYYVYLPAVLIDHDVTLQTTMARSLSQIQIYDAGIKQVSNGSGGTLPLDPHVVGMAVLMLPFFGLGHLLALVSGSTENGFSWPYQAAAVASAIAYVLAGILLTASILRRFFSRRTVAMTLVAITFGAAVFEYASYDTTQSEAYSFFLVALAVRLSIGVWQRPRLASALGLAFTLGLVALVRPTDVVIVLFCALVGVSRLRDLPSRARSLLRHGPLVMLGAGVFIVTVMPELLYLDRITGSPFTNPYEGLADNYLSLGSPHLLGVLFSVRKGLFFWTPVVLLAVVGLPLLRRYAQPLFLASVAYLVVAVWVAASWSQWWYGGSFGMRALIESMPVFALGLAALCESVRGLAGRRILVLALAVTTLLGVHGMVTYWIKAIPYDQTTWHDYLHSFVDYDGQNWNISD